MNDKEITTIVSQGDGFLQIILFLSFFPQLDFLNLKTITKKKINIKKRYYSSRFGLFSSIFLNHFKISVLINVSLRYGSRHIALHLVT